MKATRFTRKEKMQLIAALIFAGVVNLFAGATILELLTWIARKF